MSKVIMPEPSVRIPISQCRSEDTILFSAEQMESYASAKVQEILHEEAKPDNIKRAEYYGEGYADGWKAALEHAARIVSGYVGCEEIAGEVSALIPSTPA